MRLSFGFGTGSQEVEVSDQNPPPPSVLKDDQGSNVLSGTQEIERALRRPTKAPLIEDVAAPGEKVAIITSDITRPCPSWLILPSILDRLYRGGVKKEDITVIFALGSHRRHTLEEMKHLAGERAWEEVRCLDSDPEDCVCLGITSRGTPVDITREAAQADKRICIGNIEYHYFAGFSGGAKAIMPGVSSRAAIQANHSRMIEPAARTGMLSGNPIREDIEEAGKICGIDYIVNVILDEHKNIIHAVAGDVIEAHRAGCRYLDNLYRKEIKQKADIVLVSQGGAPKDLNLYQTQKALDNAAHAVRDGGIIILIGSCREGYGEKTFQRWVEEAEKPSDLIERVKKGFQLGGHKAAAIAMVFEKADIFLVSEMEENLVRQCFLTPFSNVQEAYNEAVRRLGTEASVLAMPYGGSTLPYLKGENMFAI